MTKFALFFNGAEAPVHRTMLAEAGVPHVAVNFRHLMARLPKTKPWLLKDHFPNQKVLLDSGSTGINKLGWSPEAIESYLSAYLDFVQANIDGLTFYTELDATSMGEAWVWKQRKEVWSDIAPEKFIPVWHEEAGVSSFVAMTKIFRHIGVPTLTKHSENRLRGLLSGANCLLHGLSLSHPYAAPGGLYGSINSSSWLSPSKWGESVVWDHNKLSRYSAEQKDAVRRRHYHLFLRAGFDADAILDDNSREISRYTIWAWRQMEEHMQGAERTRRINRPKVVAHSENAPTPQTADTTSTAVAHSPENAVETGSLLPAVPEELKVLPVVGFKIKMVLVEGENGEPSKEVAQRIPVASAVSLRQCESCSLAGICPEYDPERNTCAYTIPVEINTHDQLMGTLSTLLTIQAQRVLFGRMAEELHGGYPDMNISAEIDRMFRLTAATKEISDSRDMLRVSIESRGDVGVLSRIFGSKSTEPLHRVDPNKAEDALARAMRQ